jgi:hypothetical protein
LSLVEIVSPREVVQVTLPTSQKEASRNGVRIIALLAVLMDESRVLWAKGAVLDRA